MFYTLIHQTAAGVNLVNEEWKEITRRRGIDLLNKVNTYPFQYIRKNKTTLYVYNLEEHDWDLYYLKFNWLELLIFVVQIVFLVAFVFCLAIVPIFNALIGTPQL